MNSAVGDRAANLKKAVDLIGLAAEQGAQLVVLPELFPFDYVSFTERDPSLFDRAEPLRGPTFTAISAAARSHGVWVIPSIFEKEIAGVCYDTAMLIGPDGDLVGRYRKTHIALLSSPESGQEKFFFKAGNSLPVFDTPLGKIGILICYDRGFPEAWRVLVLKGAEIIAVPITTTDEDGFSEMARTRCFENGVYGIFVNRCGQEDWKHFFGGSLIAGPRGTVLAQLAEEEGVAVAQLDLSAIEATRLRMPYLRDRRPELYGSLGQTD
jgi:predicted amidohydrolase